MNFESMGLLPEIMKAITAAGYENPSPIQEKAIPLLMEGRDLLGSAQTGTGKTAAFAIPIIQKIIDKNKKGLRLPIRALVLAPTRELAEQIKDSFVTYTKFLPLKTGAVYGGVAQRRQETMIDKGVDILIATPGRLIDLINQKIVNLQNVETFVLDEADTMLDMGFIKDVRLINKLLPKHIQTLMFSATISLDIRNLSSELLTSPYYLEMAPPTLMLDTITHSLIYVEKDAKKETLLDLLVDPSLSSVLVFTKTKHVANKLAEYLKSYGLAVDAIHGNKTQNKRQQALNDFKNKKNRLLVATDIAARGIDIQELSHVINFDVPLTPETYIHRIGRTGRAGLTGSAITLCSGAEKGLVKAIIKHTNLALNELVLTPVSEDNKFKKATNYIAPEKINHQEQKKKRLAKEAAVGSDKQNDKRGKEKKEFKDSKPYYQKNERSAKEAVVTGEKQNDRGGKEKRDYKGKEKRDFKESKPYYKNNKDTAPAQTKQKAKTYKQNNPALIEALKEDAKIAKKQTFSHGYSKSSAYSSDKKKRFENKRSESSTPRSGEAAKPYQGRRNGDKKYYGKKPNTSK